jgi:hypothetical protein
MPAFYDAIAARTITCEVIDPAHAGPHHRGSLIDRPTMERRMTDPKQIAERYIALWNETDPAARRTRLADDWASDATYVDPMARVRGASEIDALIGGVHERFPNFSFKLIGKPDGHGEHIRFSWSLGPGDFVDAPIEGTDFAVIDASGRIAAVTGFIDRVPPM